MQLWHPIRGDTLATTPATKPWAPAEIFVSSCTPKNVCT